MSSTLTTEIAPPTSPSQIKNSGTTNIISKITNKIPRPSLKKLNVKILIVTFDEIRELVKSLISANPNLKVNYNQFKYVIENSLGSPHPIPWLEPYDITYYEMIEFIDNIRA